MAERRTHRGLGPASSPTRSLDSQTFEVERPLPSVLDSQPVANEHDDDRPEEVLFPTPAPTGSQTPSGQLLRPGELLDHRYRIASALKPGRLARTYRAVQVATDRDVAVKVLRTRYATHAELRATMERLGKALSQIHHPNVPTVYDVGVEAERVWTVTEFVDGETARDRLKRDGSIPLEQAMVIVMQVAAGVAAAHDKGLIHGDIKPENIHLTKDHVKVVDFLTAQFLSMIESPAPGSSGSPREFTLATAEYMAPELARVGATADVRSDIYSLALVFVELVTGKNLMVPEGAALPPELLTWRQRHHEPRIPPEIPLPIGDIVAKALAKNPRHRQPGIREFARDLESAYQRALRLARDVEPVREERWAPTLRWVVQGQAIGLLAGTLAFAFVRVLPSASGKARDTVDSVPSATAIMAAALPQPSPGRDLGPSANHSSPSTDAPAANGDVTSTAPDASREALPAPALTTSARTPARPVAKPRVQRVAKPAASNSSDAKKRPAEIYEDLPF